VFSIAFDAFSIDPKLMWAYNFLCFEENLTSKLTTFRASTSS